jgi:hypothetical protein
MPNFYYGNDSGKPYLINLDHVSFVSLEKDKLILKMLDGWCTVITGEDYDVLRVVLMENTVNREESEF